MQVVQAEGLRWWVNTYEGHVELEPVKDCKMEIYIRRSDRNPVWYVDRIYSAPPRKCHVGYEVRELTTGPYRSLKEAMVEVKKLIKRNRERKLNL